MAENAGIQLARTRGDDGHCLRLSFAPICIACALYLAFGLVAGNVLATGQAEPLRWLSASIHFAAALAFLLKGKPARWRSLVAAALLSSLAVQLFCGVAGGYWNIGHAALLGLINAVLLIAFSVVFQWQRLAPLLLGLALLGGLLLPARLYFWPLEPVTPINRGSDKRLTIVTSLPVGPFGQVNLEASFEKPAHPTHTSLSRFFIVDYADSLQERPRGRLLLAHPRALHPADLAAIDSWIRAGGEAVILADPLLAWSSELSPADARRPPVTSLLDPLLTHWGLRLEPADREDAGVVQRRLANGRLLAMIAAGHFTGSGKPCRLEEQGLIARCRLGRGNALLLADADMLQPALWMGGDGNWPAVDRDRLSDNMVLLFHWLGESEEDLPPRTGWILNNSDVCYGLTAAAMPLLLIGFLYFPLGRFRTRSGRNWESTH